MGELLNLWGAPVCFSVKYEYIVSSIRDDENLKPGSERDYENMKAGSGKGLTTNGSHDCPGHSDTLRPNSIWFLHVVYSWALDRLLGLVDVEIHCSSAWSVSEAQGAGRSPQPSPVTPDPFRPVRSPQDLEHLVCRGVSWSFQHWWKRAPSIWPACQGSPEDGAISIACLYQAWGSLV